ncbi:glycosyltransferase family 2 protein [Geomonas sp. Red32]|uniref:glycosyltransferase family 2 protein n=1 Tax=Geomonas sp. Red32 TaxID=2912856 RepID=UPI00202CDA2F|nr:glycosyltransferase family 2 protein [Geomonas sp. Red32]MCM0083490.1 glycosyltransferase family 2 protein [Geomonas sp. Red32]
MTTMLVSVIVPTYNRAHLIGRALQSIMAQSHRELEVIVVDDGSTDDTEKVVATLSAQWGRPVRYVAKSNGGCASARNLGISLATGDAVAFLDSDDEWLPTAIEEMVATLQGSGADFVYSPAYTRIGGRDTLVYPTAAGDPDRFAERHFFTTRVYVCCLLYRRRVFERFRYQESLRYNEDSDLLQRIAIVFRAAYLDKPTAVVHYHSANKSSNRVEINRALLKSAESILAEFPDFRTRLAGEGDRRIGEIVAQLAGELVLQKRFPEVVALGAEYRLRLLDRLSALLKTPLFEIAARKGRRLAEMVAGGGE